MIEGIENRAQLQRFIEDVIAGGRIASAAGRTATLEQRATTLEGRATTLEGRATTLEGRFPVGNANLVAPNTGYWRGTNGGADVGVPNTDTDTFLVDSGGTQLSFTITTGAAAEVWEFYGQAMVRADSANDTLMRFFIYAGSIVAGATWGQRIYWGTAAMQGWTTLVIAGSRATLPANSSYLVRGAVKAGPNFGGLYSRNLISGAGSGSWSHFGARPISKLIP